jgi:hypothetical protein
MQYPSDHPVHPLSRRSLSPLLRAGLRIIAAIPLLTAAVSATEAADTAKPKLAVLDIELTGDTGGAEFAAEHATRLQMESNTLRQKLAASGLYQVVDTAPALPLITQLKGQQKFLHDCNGCDLDVGRQLGVNQTLVVWVDRVSGLILSLTYEFHDVSSGQILGRKSYDFRGDNDAAWTHAISYMVKDLQRTAAEKPVTPAS